MLMFLTAKLELFLSTIWVFPFLLEGSMWLIGKKLEEKLEKKLDVWEGNSLSIGGRAVLIKTSQCSFYLKLPFIKWRRLEEGSFGRESWDKRSHKDEFEPFM
jgi:hypothetical protein